LVFYSAIRTNETRKKVNTRTYVRLFNKVQINVSITGAFLVPYFVFMFVCAIPLFFLEMSYAQFSSLGPGKAWICVPIFRGRLL